MNFYYFDVPAQINGEQLKAELGCQEVYIANDKLIIAGDLTKAAAEKGLSNHKPVAVAAPTVVEKLESVGLSIDDLKAALGL